MPAEGMALLPQPLGPPGPGADRRGVIQQPGPFLLAGQTLELRPSRIVRQQERLLAVQHRRVGTRREVGTFDLSGPQVERIAMPSRRTRAHFP